MADKLPTLNAVLAQKNGKARLPSLHDVIGSKGGKLPSLQDVLSGKHQAVAAAPATHHHGVGGFFQNLAGDVKDSVLGLPAGIVKTVEHPVEAAKAIGHSYAQMYGPLLHGDVNKFVHNLYNQPLGPILDATAFLSGGASLAGKAGLLSEAGRTVDLASPGARAGEELATVLKKPIVGGELQRRARIGIHNQLNKLPPNTTFLGATDRYARAVDRLPRQEAMRLRNSPEARTYNRAVKKLSHEEFAAMSLVGRGIHSADTYLNFLKGQGSVEPVMLKVLENPKVRQLVETPNAKVLDAVEAARGLGNLSAELKTSRGLLEPAVAAERPYLPAKILSGAKWDAKTGGFVGGKSVDELRAEFDAMGKPQPTYLPDVIPGSKMSNADFQKMGGGIGNPKLPGSVRQNQGVLFQTGKLALHPDVLGPKFLEDVKFGLFTDIHNELLSSGVRVDDQWLRLRGMPHGWVFLRKRVGKAGSQKIDQTLLKSGDIKRELSQLTGDVPETFWTKTPDDAFRLHDEYVIVPQRLADHLAGEFTRSSAATRWLLEKPTRVWRGLVLGLRVGFLTNNVIGNHLLYAIQAAGVDGLRAYLNAVKRVKGESVVKGLLRDKQIPEALRQKFMDEFFPEQSQGSAFGATQAPKLNVLTGRKGRAIKGATLGVLPATQALAETSLRRALVEFYVRKSPEFRTVYKAMPRQARDFEEAAQKILRGDGGPQLQQRVSEQVNNALGDYLHMSKFEQQTLRGLFPFYSWYRAITRIATHIAVDTPGRADLLAKVSQLGVQDTENQLQQLLNGPVPEYLKGLLPVGGRKVMTTGGVNPFQTIDQLLSGTTGLLAGKPGETGKALTQLGPNPFALAMLQSIAGKNLFTGQALPSGQSGLPAQVVAQVGGQLPQSQLVKAFAGQGRQSKLYGRQSGLEALAAYLGVPVKTLQGR